MKSYLLDTCTLIWYLKNSKHLPESVREELSEAENKVYVSFFSLWEIALKRKKNPLAFDPLNAPISELRKMIDEQDFAYIEIFPLSALARFENMEYHPQHKDPIDRTHIAIAQAYNLHFVTPDERIHEYKNVRMLKYKKRIVKT